MTYNPTDYIGTNEEQRKNMTCSCVIDGLRLNKEGICSEITFYSYTGEKMMYNGIGTIKIS